MILAVDIGNTHIEIGLYRQTEYLGSWRIATAANRSEDELMVFIQHFLSLKGVKPEAVGDIAIASVVPNITQIFLKLVERYFKTKPLLISHQLDLGIQIDYEPPGSVGADRLCNAVAAYMKYGAPVIIVDFGTATTIEFVSSEGVYLGGAIAPGLETAAWGLHERASKLPKIPLVFPENAIGRTSEASMQSGIMLGTVKMIDGLIELMQEELGTKAVVVATGGLSGILSLKSRYIEHLEPQLVLNGLVAIYLRNKNRVRS